LLPQIFALEFDIKENFSQGETIISKISGTFISPITNANVFFYRGHIEIPMDYSISKIEEDYYLYVKTLGKSSGNYSVSIKGIQYMKGSEVSNENITRNFSITEQVADFSVEPGFAIVSNDFYLQFQNLQENQLTLEINTELASSSAREIFILPELSKTSSIPLKSGQIKKINFHFGEGLPAKKFIEIKSGNLSYEIPIYIFTSYEESKTKSFGIDPSTLVLTVLTNKQEKRAVYLFNEGEEDLQNISLSLSDSLISSMNISQSKIENLNAKSGIQIELSFFSAQDKKVEGSLRATAGDKVISSAIAVSFSSNSSLISNVTQSPSATSRTCVELNGTICAENKECDKAPIYAKDNVCCLGNCGDSAESSTGRVIAIVLTSIILIGIGFFYFKYKKTKKPINLLEIAKGKPKP